MIDAPTSTRAGRQRQRQAVAAGEKLGSGGAYRIDWQVQAKVCVSVVDLGVAFAVASRWPRAPTPRSSPRSRHFPPPSSSAPPPPPSRRAGRPNATAAAALAEAMIALPLLRAGRGDLDWPVGTSSGRKVFAVNSQSPCGHLGPVADMPSKCTKVAPNG